MFLEEKAGCPWFVFKLCTAPVRFPFDKRGV
jgi:hypothetical protein